MRVVLDTNVLIAAFASRGLCEAIMAVCLHEHEIICSEHILAELRRNLAAKVKMSAEQAGEIVAFVRAHATIVAPEPVPPETLADPQDLPVLGTALSGAARFLVTGDQGMLKLRSHRTVKVVSPREFYDALT